MKDRIELFGSCKHKPYNSPMKTTKIYVMKPSEAIVGKIGLSQEPESRLGEVQTGSWERLRLAHQVDIGTRDGNKIETNLHAFFHRHRLVGEWFNWTDASERVFERLRTASKEQIQKILDALNESRLTPTAKALLGE